MKDQTPSIQAITQSKAHRLASFWEISLKNGTTLRFTDHQYALTFDGNSYSALSAAGKSSLRSPLGLRERNLTFIGYLSSTAIEEEDLRAGLFNNASVIEYVADWRYPWQGAIITNSYYITEMVWTGEDWEAQLDGLTTKLRQPVGRLIGRRCGWILGDTDCGVTIASHTVSTTITAIDTQRRVFQTGLSQADSYFDFGLVAWTSGNNNGYDDIEIASFANTNGVVSLALPTAFDLQIGDGLDIYPGCNKTVDACKGTAGSGTNPWTTNLDNFGGFPFVPGNVKALETPNSI